ncbi:methylated-DNA--[protein]-cysteine S-methyltransferase [Moritella sp. F3]|uniref:methylated-DNA--[protein]-cysteine S-methyltransferase n=1 Tax=Moritella sp. F3 TaxID=2718882 RepID=UPI0018E1709D|nr:methylated-DNA--[protein]-cysteine S-methyltransferase [Moritella sp. F3]GIC79211.1 methylated-DNA--protein-cysteine methyltransferase [Moritella sp. F1]GIC81101.1 methylated-DNA--protein-cysteine methyltransferase [Moritella sp. F3]
MYYDKFSISYTSATGEQECHIILVGDDTGITQLMIDNGTKPIQISAHWQHSSTYFNEAKQQLREYFTNKRQVFELRLNPLGTVFQRHAWQQLIKMPYGETRRYKDIAAGLGNPNASRAVGMANNKNPIPIIIPCHRVIGANNKLVGYAYGLELKQQLLALEQSH